MIDPVTISSGKTFERESIEQYFAMQREKAEKAFQDDDSEIEDLRVEDFFTCPITQNKVDPDLLIKNLNIAAATETFLDENPWAYEYNPKEKFEDILLWQWLT